MVERFGQIPGLCLASGYTAPRDLTDLTTLPFLYEDMEPFTNRIIYYETSRGCPYRCSYCLSSIDKKVRLRDISVVKRELQFFLDQNVKQVKFIDRTFNCDHKHAMEIWRYIYEHDNGVTNFHFEISADLLNEEELALIRERMDEAGIRNMGAYIRKMALNGYVLHVDLSPVRELVSLQRRCSNNLNQVAIQANTYGGIYPEEIAALQRDYAALWGPLSDLLKKLSALVEL